MERARALNPGTPRLLTQYGVLLATLGRLPEAVAVLQQASLLDPLSADVPSELAIAYLGTGQLDLAEAAATHALELEPEHGRAARTLGFALLLQQRLPEAQAAFRRSTNPFFRDMGAAMVSHSMGRAAESQGALDRMLAQPTVLKGSYQIAQIYAWRGEAGRAFEWLGHALEERDPGLTYLKRDPVLRPLRGDPRFAALLKTLNLPED
jgi:serine/threonine-protein kinase